MLISMRKSKVVLIGTAHEYQIGDAKTEEDSIAQFRQLLIALCSKHSVKAIAEEMSQAFLEECGVSESIAYSVAAEMKLEHQLSDPPPELRTQLGIRTENDIRAHGFLNNWNQQQIETEIRKSHDIRERYWLDQVLSLNTWPLLFVCGAIHSEPFSALLRDRKFEVIVPFSDWEPNPSFHRKLRDETSHRR